MKIRPITNIVSGFLAASVFLILILIPQAPAEAFENFFLADAGSGIALQDDGIAIQGVESVAAPELPVLTIENSLATARESNWNLLMAKQAVELTSAAGQSALVRFLPDLSFNFFYTRYAAAQTISIPDTEISYELQPADNLFAGLTFRYPIYEGGSREATQRQIDADIETSRQQLNQAITLIDMNTVNAYCTAREGFGGLAISQASYDHLVELERQAQAMYDAGYMPLSDILSIRVAVASARQHVVEWTNNIQTRQSALALAMGVDISSRWQLAPVEWPIVKMPYSLETLTGWAFENRPEFKEFRAKRDKILAQIDQVNASNGPNVRFEASFSERAGEFSFSNLSASLSGTVSVHWDLYDFGKTDDLIAPLQQQLSLLDIQEEQLRQSIRQQIEEAYYSLDTAYYGVQVANESLVQAEEALRVSRRRFEEGLGLTVEVLDAEATWTRIGANTIFASHGYYRTLAALAMSCGISTPDMIALIEAAGENVQ